MSVGPIEKDIAVWPKKGGKMTAAREAAAQMEVDDSRLCDTLEEAEYVRGSLKSVGRGGQVRKDPCGGGWRVWRIA